MGSCSVGGSSFTPTTIDFEVEGSEYRSYTNDPANSDIWPAVYITTPTFSGDNTFTTVVKRVQGKTTLGYGMYFRIDADTRFYIMIDDTGLL